MPSWDDLQPGDILNRYNGHALMFGGWKIPGSTFYSYEAGPFAGWRVTMNVMGVDYLRPRGYVPLRYRKMRDQVPKSYGTTAPVSPPAAAPAPIPSPAPATAPTAPTIMTIPDVHPRRSDLPPLRHRIGGRR